MGTAVAAYVIVWLLVSGFVGWLGVRQNQLDSRLAELESRSGAAAENKPSIADAA